MRMVGAYITSLMSSVLFFKYLSIIKIKLLSINKHNYSMRDIFDSLL